MIRCIFGSNLETLTSTGGDFYLADKLTNSNWGKFLFYFEAQLVLAGDGQ